MFTIYWNVCNQKEGCASPLNLPTGINSNAFTVYEHVLAPDVREQGLHITLDSGFKQKLFTRMQEDFAKTIPNVQQTGVAFLDIETIAFQYGGYVPGYKGSGQQLVWNKWKEYLELKWPQVFIGKTEAQKQDYISKSYAAQVGRFVQMCFECARKLRPGLKWGQYGYPNWRNAEYGYPRPNKFSLENDALGWLWKTTDISSPCLYLPYRSVSDSISSPEPGLQNSWFVNNMLKTNTLEGRRCVGEGKLVIPYVGLYHMEYCTPNIREQWLSDEDLEKTIMIPKENGANGVIIWGIIDSEEKRNQYQKQIDERLMPLLYKHNIVMNSTPDFLDINLNELP